MTNLASLNFTASGNRNINFKRGYYFELLFNRFSWAMWHLSTLHTSLYRCPFESRRYSTRRLLYLSSVQNRSQCLPSRDVILNSNKSFRYVVDPNNNPLSSVRDLQSTPYSYLGADVLVNETYLWTPQNHYGAVAMPYDRNQRCEFGLRLTNSLPNSHGSITTLDK